MTTIEYMEKQLSMHKANLTRETARGVSQEMLDNIKKKITYYQEACIALRCVQDNEAVWEISSDGYYPYCSNCKEQPERKVTNFCPNCGKAMKTAYQKMLEIKKEREMLGHQCESPEVIVAKTVEVLSGFEQYGNSELVKTYKEMKGYKI